MVQKLGQLMNSLLSLDNISENVYRSHGPHVGGVIEHSRLFGGYIAAQVYEAVRRHRLKTNEDNNLIFSMHYNFIAAGNPQKPIDIKINQFGKVYTAGVFHENKNIGLAHVKVDNQLMKSPSYPSDIPGLLENMDLETLVKNKPGKYGKFYEYLINNFIFQLRPFHLVTIPSTGEFQTVFYARVVPETIEHIREDGGMTIIVCLSDFIVFQSFQNALNQKGFRIGIGASLHHKVYFHQEKVEPMQWFLMESRTEIATGNKIKITGSIFDSNKNCVVSFVQEAYTVPEKIDNQSKL